MHLASSWAIQFMHIKCCVYKIPTGTLGKWSSINGGVTGGEVGHKHGKFISSCF